MGIDLEGAIDLHFHAGPDVRERKLTYLEAAIQARDAGMKAILIKSHSTITADIASLIQPLVKDILVFGGIALNYPLGGLNPIAVETALKLGAKQIWMPTLHAANQYRYDGVKGGITVLILTSDFGQPENPFPVEGLKIYIERLKQFGLSDQEIDQMVRINPERLLNLS